MQLKSTDFVRTIFSWSIGQRWKGSRQLKKILLKRRGPLLPTSKAQRGRVVAWFLIQVLYRKKRTHSCVFCRLVFMIGKKRNHVNDETAALLRCRISVAIASLQSCFNIISAPCSSETVKRIIYDSRSLLCFLSLSPYFEADVAGLLA